MVSRMSAGKLDLQRIVYIGRTFKEYMKMFNLKLEELNGRRILDCPAGACSFIAEANRLGADAVAADIAYYYSAEELLNKGLVDLDHTLVELEKVQENFKWDYFESIEGLRRARTEALTVNTSDRREHGGRYIPTRLPVLPFAGQSFDLSLSAHFLFMYGDRLDIDFHLQTLRELMRVTREEIRIFPLVDLTGRRYEHLDVLIRSIQSEGWSTEEIQVPYEFQKGANSMLLMKKL